VRQRVADLKRYSRDTARSPLRLLAISVAFENEVWRDRTRRLRAWLWVLALAWFNAEVWGRVAYTLIHWGRG